MGGIDEMSDAPRTGTPTLFVFGGLPGTGKTELSQALARRLRAVHLRIDTVEQALRDEGHDVTGPEGYVVACQLARDNLRLGLSVVADAVNPIAWTRQSWRQVATDAGVRCCEIEVVCSDEAEHRRRVESRASTVPGLRLPSWQEVLDRDYEPWPEAAIVVDTAGETPGQSQARLARALAELGIPTW